ncbi:MAG: MarR family transcriptional regulator [candidate division Zixibacteria bacterium]|nr:MarR family transcriptional regulator [candidate division Zixibacteria bacterium]
MVTEIIENYLKAIYELQRKYQSVPTNALAESLSIAPASVTGMIKKLAENGFLTYTPYRGVELTPEGMEKALKVIRVHRLAELYMVKMLGVPWDKVHEEAEKWEHVLSEELEERIEALLGYPKWCPHGSPIPSREGKVEYVKSFPLTELAAGISAVIAEVDDRNPELLRYLGELGLIPGEEIELVEIAPFDSLFRIKQGESQIDIGKEAASKILVTVIVE